MSNPREEDWSMIRRRAALLRRVRQWFDRRGFVEVQPPCLSWETIPDLHIDPIAVDANQLGLGESRGPQLFLQTSPEAAMKRMLAQDVPSIYSLGPVFRSGESGALHNVEFTMLEWYQREAALAEGIETLGSFVTEILGRDRFQCIRYRDLFRERLGFDPIDSSLATLQDRVAEIDRSLATSLAHDRDGMLDVLLTERLQSALGLGDPMIVTHYPLSQAALACVSEDDPQTAARFELFADGVELANGYDELRDVAELARRFQHCNKQRVAKGRASLPLPNQLLAAMRQRFPPCAGVALGFDRLLMVASGRHEISDVLPFPIDRASCRAEFDRCVWERYNEVSRMRNL